MRVEWMGPVFGFRRRADPCPTLAPPPTDPPPAADRITNHWRRRQTVPLFLVSLLLAMLFMVGAAIDCFKCVSLNGNNPSCEDPFHNNYSSSILEAPCMGGRKGRNGLFPATACIKLTGTYSDTGESMVVRTCAVDSGSLTLDTELARISHCGSFYAEDRYVKGCLQSCDDADGCNDSSRPKLSLYLLRLLPPLLLLLRHFQTHLLAF